MESDLIYDVGANNGDDTAYYLQRGYRVVAVEANPQLASDLDQRFADEITAGRVTVANVGVWDAAGTLDFYVNDDVSEFSSFVKDVGARDGARFHVEQVQTVPFGELLTKYGVPYYLKVDIETADVHCIQGLDPADLPAYVSIEAHHLEYLAILWGLGYRKFKAVDQASHNKPDFAFDNESLRGRVASAVECRRRRHAGHSGPFPVGASGPFGEETPGEWQTFRDVAYEWLHFTHQRRDRGHLNMRGWYDFHAKLI